MPPPGYPDERKTGPSAGAPAPAPGSECYLSLVVPCYNGEAVIAGTLAKLLAHLRASPERYPSWEIIVVDDGSTDRSAEIVAGFPEVRLVRQTNTGKGGAVRTGMLAASGRFRVFTDADMPFAPAAIDRCVDYLDRKEFHVCIGARNERQVDEHARRSTLRKVASHIFTAIVSRVVVTGVRDTQCGLKGFRADVADYLFREGRVNGFAFDVELLYLAFKNDLDIKRIPVRLVSQDVSTVSVVRHGISMLGSIALLPVRFYTGRYTMMERSDLETTW